MWRMPEYWRFNLREVLAQLLTMIIIEDDGGGDDSTV